MKFKMTGRRVLTSPMVKSGAVLIDGGEFDDGLFRLIVPEDTTPEQIKAFESAVFAFADLLARRAWMADLLGTDREVGSSDV